MAREVIAACLAADLDLPIPIPYLVDIPPELAEIGNDFELANQIKCSSPVAFGSMKVDNQFNTWIFGYKISESMTPVALATLVFDSVIENPDRRMSNPNCLVSGDNIRLIDHDLAFPSTEGLIGWKPPWQLGALDWLETNRHIFYVGLRKKRNLDFTPILDVWSNVSNVRLKEYRAAIPPEWDKALPTVDKALERIRNARDNIDSVTVELQRVLR